MSLQTVSQYLKNHIKDNFSDCKDSVLLVPSIASYILSGKHKNIGVAIIYAGGSQYPPKPAPAHIINHHFNVYVFLTIWKPEKVVEGEGTRKGLYELRDILLNLLDGLVFDSVRDTSILEYYGTEDYPQLGAEGFSASIGFKIQCKEQII